MTPNLPPKHRLQPDLNHFNGHAVFLDIDGTLADIVATPSQARIPASTLRDVAELSRRLDGALALISGRHLDDIDTMTGMATLAAAGIHGAQIRTRDGQQATDVNIKDRIASIVSVLQAQLKHMEGIYIERKPLAVAIHYRACPQSEEHVVALVQEIVAQHATLKHITGKYVVEILPAIASKGAAIAHFMNLAPFQGRIPIFAGDDVTDEDGFIYVNTLKGVTIKIGSGPSNANFGFDGAEEFRRWLDKLTWSK